MHFFLDKLLKRSRIKYSLNIHVSLKSDDVSSEDGAINAGIVWEELIDGERWYIIHLDNSVPFLELLSNLAHESVHVVQFATGRLKADDEWVWKGVSYGNEPYKGTELDTQLPWEYDAYSKEIELARQFVKHFYSNW